MKQEIKIEYNNTCVFFWQHTFRTALTHANYFIERNKGNFEMKVYLLNESYFGEKWKLFKTIK